MPPRSGLERSDFVRWHSTSVRYAVAIFPESEIDRMSPGHRENGAHDPQ